MRHLPQPFIADRKLHPLTLLVACGAHPFVTDKVTLSLATAGYGLGIVLRVEGLGLRRTLLNAEQP